MKKLAIGLIFFVRLKSLNAQCEYRSFSNILDLVKSDSLNFNFDKKDTLVLYLVTYINNSKLNRICIADFCFPNKTIFRKDFNKTVCRFDIYALTNSTLIRDALKKKNYDFYTKEQPIYQNNSISKFKYYIDQDSYIIVAKIKVEAFQYNITNKEYLPYFFKRRKAKDFKKIDINQLRFLTISKFISNEEIGKSEFSVYDYKSPSLP